MMDVKAPQSDAKDSCGGGAFGRARNPGQQNVGQQHAPDDSLHREIKTLIARPRRYLRQLTRDSAAADDLVQHCVARALGKIHLWEPGTDLRAGLFPILHKTSACAPNLTRTRE
jgi:Sigma-70 region 2